MSLECPEKIVVDSSGESNIHLHKLQTLDIQKGK